LSYFLFFAVAHSKLFQMNPSQLNVGSIYQLHYVSWCQNEVKLGRFLGHLTKYMVTVEPENPLSYGSDMPLWKTKEDYDSKLQIFDTDGNIVSLDDVKQGTLYRVRKMLRTGEWGNERKATVLASRSDLMDFEIINPVHEPSIRRIRVDDEHYKIYRFGANIGTDDGTDDENYYTYRMGAGEIHFPSADTYKYAYSLLKEEAWNRRAPLISWRRECLGW
jgi:hypothetical protein